MKSFSYNCVRSCAWLITVLFITADSTFVGSTFQTETENRHSLVEHLNATIKSVFSDTHLKECGRLRTPFLVQTPSRIMVLARCCGKNLCSEKSDSSDFGDDDSDSQVVAVSSTDGGQSWHNYTVLSPGKGFAGAAAIYDRVRKHVVLQFQFIAGGKTSPIRNTTYYQQISFDDGLSWSKPQDITGQLRGCQFESDNQMIQSAGNKVQSSTGRLLFAGHDHTGHVCIWYSDDGGKSYRTSQFLQGNEISITEAEKGKLVMNGRSQQFSWSPHRAEYWSTDDGVTWTSPSKSALKDPSDGACERSLLNIDNILYSSEPTLPKRQGLVIQCSKDAGKSWESSRGINGDDSAGYSDIANAKHGKLLVVWEYKPSGNFYAAQIGTEWC
eukprot:gene1630-4765_t